MKMQKLTALTCGLVLCLGLSGCGDDNKDLSDSPTTIALVAYDAQKDNDYTIEYKMTDAYTATPFEVAYAYESAVIKEAYGKEAVIGKMTMDTTGRMTIDFLADKVQSLSLGASSEAAVFENLVESIILNCPEITAVYFTMDGGNFETGHLSFAADTAVWSRTQK